MAAKNGNGHKQSGRPDIFKLETVAIADLHPHPRNYRTHPDDEIEHLMASIREHGIYKNVVVARDGTILAGHGVVQAAAKMELKSVPVIRLDIEPNEPRALKVLAGDNEIGHLSEIDDRMLTEILKEINDIDLDGLLGTGFDEKMLANLVFVTRPENEIRDYNEAAAWVGMPEYEEGDRSTDLKIVINFRNEADRAEFAEKFGLNFTKKMSTAWTMRWPPHERQDVSSVKFVGESNV